MSKALLVTRYRESRPTSKEYHRALERVKSLVNTQNEKIGSATEKIEELAKDHIPKLYEILTVTEGRQPKHARAIIIQDLVIEPDKPVWKKATILKHLPKETKDLARAKAGEESARIRNIKRQMAKQERVAKVELPKSLTRTQEEAIREQLAQIVNKPTRDTILTRVSITKDNHEKMVLAFAESGSRGYTLVLRNGEFHDVEPIAS